MTALLVAAGLVIVLIGLPTPRGLAGRGVLTLILYVALYVLATLLPVPKAILSLTAGLVFGIPGGIAVTLVGATLGAVVAFYLARVLGRAPIEQYGGRRLAWLDDRLTRHGFVAMVGLRLVPLVPFTALNYAAGLTRISWPAYTLGTLLGITPGAVLYVVLGAYGRRPGSWPFVALAAAVVFTVSGLIVARRQSRPRRGCAPMRDAGK
ncbi:MAG: TVP38/TMEM64 family protein [Catenulispora sp.]|nr:TVP38/TMEM64 family protein [Catenulispora sp.]